MRGAALLAVYFGLCGFVPGQATVPLQGLSEEDVGADALRDALCYAHDGPRVLVVAAEKNAVVNSDGDLRLLRREDWRSPLSSGAHYVGTSFELKILPNAEGVSESMMNGRRDLPAEISVRKGKTRTSTAVRWNCKVS